MDWELVDEEWFSNKFDFEIIPLLEEYYFDDVNSLQSKIGLIQK